MDNQYLADSSKNLGQSEISRQFGNSRPPQSRYNPFAGDESSFRMQNIVKLPKLRLTRFNRAVGVLAKCSKKFP